MQTIGCDASPLIFLAKLNRLDLIQPVLDGDVFVLRCVVDEVLTGQSVTTIGDRQSVTVTVTTIGDRQSVTISDYQ